MDAAKGVKRMKTAYESPEVSVIYPQLDEAVLTDEQSDIMDAETGIEDVIDGD